MPLPDQRRGPSAGGTGLRQNVLLVGGNEPHNSTASPTLRLYDDAAEQAIAACAAFSTEGARLAADRLTCADFHDPRAWWIVEAALVADRSPAGPGPEPEWRTEDRIATAANVDPLVLRDWCRHATAATDTSGDIARRVRTAATARKRAHALIEELEQLGIEVEVTA